MTHHPTRTDIAAVIYAIYRIAMRLHLKSEPDARSVAFLVGTAEVILRAKASGALLGHAATEGAQKAISKALGRVCLAAVDDHPEAYNAGLMAGAAAAGTIRADRGGWLLSMALGVSAAHGMSIAEAVGVLTVGGRPETTGSI